MKPDLIQPRLSQPLQRLLIGKHPGIKVDVMLPAKGSLQSPDALQNVFELGQGLAAGDSRSQGIYGPPLLQDLSDLLYPRLIGKDEIASLSLLGERAIKTASLTSAGDK